jgi:hypothetical protein
MKMLRFILFLVTLLLTLPAPAQSANQVGRSAVTLTPLTNLVASASTGGPTNTGGAGWFIITNSTPVPVIEGEDVSLSCMVTAGSNNVSTLTNLYDLGYIRAGVTQWTTTRPIAFTFQTAGSTNSVGFTNVPATMLGNAQLLRWSATALGTNTGMSGTAVLSNHLAIIR